MALAAQIVMVGLCATLGKIRAVGSSFNHPDKIRARNLDMIATLNAVYFFGEDAAYEMFNTPKEKSISVDRLNANAET